MNSKFNESLPIIEELEKIPKNEMSSFGLEFLKLIYKILNNEYTELPNDICKSLINDYKKDNSIWSFFQMKIWFASPKSNFLTPNQRVLIGTLLDKFLEFSPKQPIM